MNLNNLLYIIFFNSWNLNQRQWRQSSACQLAGAMQPDLKRQDNGEDKNQLLEYVVPNLRLYSTLLNLRIWGAPKPRG